MSVAVRVALPTVLRVALKILLPDTRLALAGRLAMLSVAVRPTVCETLLTTFQLASTALTVTLKATPEVRAVVGPVLPVAVPGAAGSPRAPHLRFTEAPGLN